MFFLNKTKQKIFPFIPELITGPNVIKTRLILAGILSKNAIKTVRSVMWNEESLAKNEGFNAGGCEAGSLGVSNFGVVDFGTEDNGLCQKWSNVMVK